MGAVWAALATGRSVVVALPKPASPHPARRGGPASLAAHLARAEAQLKAMGAPAAVAAAWAGRDRLASAVAHDRDELILAVTTLLQTSRCADSANDVRVAVTRTGRSGRSPAARC